jgi:hypothetical protein
VKQVKKNCNSDICDYRTVYECRCRPKGLFLQDDAEGGSLVQGG